MAVHVYFIRSGNKKGHIKIGVAANVSQRMGDLQIGNPHELTLVASIPCLSRKQAYSVEGLLHRTFKKHHVRGEWFNYKINLKKVGHVFKKSDLEVIKFNDEFISDAGKITRLKAKVTTLERTIKWQEEEIDRLLEAINTRY